MNPTIEHQLLYKIPKIQIERVFNQQMCDINSDFIGFIDIYESLSKIIPKHFTVIDLGCAYNPQCFYFKQHKQYVSVDISKCEKFKSENCIIFEKYIEKFINENLTDYNLDETFAICSYVPLSKKTSELVRKTFKNVFLYYPSGGY